MLSLSVLCLLHFACSPKTETANSPPSNEANIAPPSPANAETGTSPDAPASATTNASPVADSTTAAESAESPSSSANPATAAVPSPAVSSTRPANAANPPGSPPNSSSNPDQGGADEPVPSSEEIQLSFNGANIEAIVKWLAKTTGKSVVKHPQVNCRLTIVSSRSLPAREAVDLVYRALALEGFATVETATSIIIVPEGKEPKISPELTTESANDLPEGRQRFVKIFSVTNVPASEIKERLNGVVSEGSTVEADDRGNRLIVTGYTDNVRLLGELIQRLDVGSSADTEVKIFSLKFLEANDLANLLNLVLNNKAGTPSSGRSSSSPSSSTRRIVSGGRVITIPGPSSSGPPPSPGSPSGSGASPGADQGGDQEIRLWPDINSNRLIVSAPKARMGDVEDLIGMLDVEKPADVSLRIIPLRHVDALNLVQDIAPLYQRMSGQSLKDTIEIAANERANSLIILSSESNYRAIKTVLAELDTPDAQEKILRTFPLQNADAEDVADQLQQLNQENTGMARYVYYYSMPSSSGRSSAKLTVVADRRRNTVIVQGPPASMEGVADIINALDEPVEDNSLAPRIYPLKYVGAVDIEEVLNELFLKREDDGSVLRSYIFGFPSTPSRRDSDAGRLYGKVRITSEPNSNAIIVTSNSPENLEAVEAVLKQLDVPSQAGENTLRIPLKFAEAVPTANNLNILFARGGSPPLRQQGQPNQPNDPRNLQANASVMQGGFQLEQERKEEQYYPWLGGQPETFRTADGRTTTRSASDLVGRVRVVADERSNSLLITASVHHFPEVLKLINELDAPTAQVLIEAKIVEVAGDFRDRLGIRFSPDGSQVFEGDDFDNSLMPSGSLDYLKVFAGSPGEGSLQSGVLNANLNLDFLIQFLRKTTDAKVLAQPQINVSDNELGKLFVGAQVPFIFNSINTDVGGRNDSFQYKDVGIILEVTPHINNAEEVALKIHAESSNIRSGETLFGGAILDTRNFHTDLLVKSGETIVLGGIIQQEEAEIIRKIPLLGDIPVLGYLFKKKDKVSRNVELMVFLKPRITRSPEEAARLMREVRASLPRLSDWERKMKEEIESHPDAGNTDSKPQQREP